VSPQRQEIAREARVVGLRELSAPSLEAVEARRGQLWTIAFFVMAALAVAMVLVSFDSKVGFQGFHLANLGAFRVGVVLLTLAFAAYLFEKEIHLRRLTRLLIDERVLTAALSNRLGELATLCAVGKAVNSVLDLEQVLDIILSSACELLGGESGSVMLLDGPDQLRSVCVVGSNELAANARVRLGEGIAGHVAQSRQPMLINGPADHRRFLRATEREKPVPSAVSVPLTNRGNLLGVLNVNSGSRMFTDYDLRALVLFAEQAAMSIANARLYQVERTHVEELIELDHMKSEFVATVSHELRTPLTSILASVQTLQRRELDAETSDELLEMIDRQGQKLLRLIEDILELQQPGGGPSIQLQPLELGPLVAEVLQLEGAAGRKVATRVPDDLAVMADPAAVERILINLIDNGFVHGGGVVEVEAELIERTSGPLVRLSVLDRGPGVDPEDVDRVFDRFSRGSGAPAASGMGLGLYLVRTLVEAQGGGISVARREDGGAAFHVFLPVGQ
jgi:two-component system sensor histidine kinase KdpD